MLAPNYKSNYLKVFNHCTSLQVGRFRVRIPVAARNYYRFQNVQGCCAVHTASYTVGDSGLFQLG